MNWKRMIDEFSFPLPSPNYVRSRCNLETTVQVWEGRQSRSLSSHVSDVHACHHMRLRTQT